MILKYISLFLLFNNLLASYVDDLDLREISEYKKELSNIIDEVHRPKEDLYAEEDYNYDQDAKYDDKIDYRDIDNVQDLKEEAYKDSYQEPIRKPQLSSLEDDISIEKSNYVDADLDLDDDLSYEKPKLNEGELDVDVNEEDLHKPKMPNMKPKYKGYGGYADESYDGKLRKAVTSPRDRNINRKHDTNEVRSNRFNTRKGPARRVTKKGSRRGVLESNRSAVRPAPIESDRRRRPNGIQRPDRRRRPIGIERPNRRRRPAGVERPNRRRQTSGRRPNRKRQNPSNRVKTDSERNKQRTKELEKKGQLEEMNRIKLNGDYKNRKVSTKRRPLFPNSYEPPQEITGERPYRPPQAINSLGEDNFYPKRPSEIIAPHMKSADNEIKKMGGDASTDIKLDDSDISEF